MSQHEHSRLHYPAWKTSACTYTTVTQLTVKQKRKIFAMLRADACNRETLLVRHGINLGEFCTMHILHEHAKK